MSLRLDDDLCQLVLSYLDFKDKVRLEGVCRQWQRLIYNDLTEMEYPFYDRESHYLWSGMSREERLIISRKIIEKCRFIRRLRVYPVCDTSMMKIIADYCPQLHSIELKFDSNPIDERVIEEFARSCGKNLTKFSIMPNETNDQGNLNPTFYLISI